MKFQIEDVLPVSCANDSRFVKEFESYTAVRNYSRGHCLTLEGDDYFNFYIVISGRIRVYKASEYGKEITLYQVGPGESCILSAFGLMSRGQFMANAVIDADTCVVEIPAGLFRDWMNRYQCWREHLFLLLGTHLSTIIAKIESLVFQRVDERIARYLARAAAKHQDELKMTHSQIARELGTAREVVSRTLRSFEKAQMVALSRGSIAVIDQQGLLNFNKLYGFAS